MVRGIFTNCVVLAALILTGWWVDRTILPLTGVAGTKLFLGRAAICGVLSLCGVLWLWRHRWAVLVSALARRLEARQQRPLIRVTTAGALERISCILLALSAMTLTLFAALDRSGFIHAFREDGPFEYATAAFYLIACVFCLSYAVVVRKRTRLSLWLVALAVLFLFVGGEEISWGQRLIGFGTPEDLATINVQGEFTLHNLYSNSLFVYPGLAVVAALLGLLPLLHRKSALFRRLLDALEFPVAPLSTAWFFALVLACYSATGLILGSPTPLPINWSNHLPHYDDEMFEFLVAGLFAIQSLAGWRIVRRTKGQAKRSIYVDHRHMA